MTADRRDSAGYRAAARRFPASVPSLGPSLAEQRFTLADILDDPAGIGRATAAAKLHGNASARAALNDLRNATKTLDYFEEVES
jgi:hypothetical protein